jgi:hypothetical protein
MGDVSVDLHVLANGVMDVISDAITVSAMTNKRLTMTITAKTKTCIGSKRFGIETHEARVDDFPKQASQPDGLGRMCREHWKTYTAGLRKDAVARKSNMTADKS